MAKRKKEQPKTMAANPGQIVDAGESAGQSGDDQGLDATPGATSQSVKELNDEGQFFEAGIVSGVENAPPADESEVKTKEVAEEDVPFEYDEDGRPDTD